MFLEVPREKKSNWGVGWCAQRVVFVSKNAHFPNLLPSLLMQDCILDYFNLKYNSSIIQHMLHHIQKMGKIKSRSRWLIGFIWSRSFFFNNFRTYSSLLKTSVLPTTQPLVYEIRRLSHLSSGGQSIIFLLNNIWASRAQNVKLSYHS